MFESFLNLLYTAVAVDSFALLPLVHIIIRSLFIYSLGILFVRCNKKLLGAINSFNMILFMLMGSLFADAIINADHFLIDVVTLMLLTFCNGLITRACFYIPFLETVVEGSPSTIIKDGELKPEVMEKNFLTPRELENELSMQLHTKDIAQVKAATMSSDGRIKFVKKDNAQAGSTPKTPEQALNEMKKKSVERQG